MFVFLESDAQHSFHLHKLQFNHKDYNVFEYFTNLFKVSKLSHNLCFVIYPSPPPLKKKKEKKSWKIEITNFHVVYCLVHI